MIGKEVNRVEGPLKVSGHAPYAADYPAEGLLHGVIVGSSIANGKVLSIDSAAASALPGVVAVFTHENRPAAGSIGMRYRDLVGPPGTPFRPLHDDLVLFADQPVALVVAESYEAARDAAALVRVSYQEEPFETDLDRAVAASFVPTLPRPFVHRPPSPRGDAEAAFATAPLKIEAHYETAPEYHNPIELFATTAVLDADGKMTVYDKNQGSQNVQLYLRLALGLKAMDLKVVNAYVGGAFGSGLRPAHTVFLAALIANHLGRSLRVVATRSQMFATTYRPHTRQRVELGCGLDGRLVSVRHHAVGATSNYEDQQEVVVNWSGLAYACDNVKLSYEVAKLATPTPADMRAPGAASGQFALECAADELAELAGMDPLAFRLANWVAHDQNSGKEITAKAQRECYAEGAERFGWKSRDLKPRSRRDGHELIGWGMAGGIWEAAMAPLPSRARATWRAGGRLEIAAAASDIGTGTYTILAQIAAESFGIEADQVAVLLGDSSLPYNPIEGGSWMAASTGAAVARACDKLKRELLKAAHHSHEVPRRPTGVRFEGGRMLGAAIPGGALPLGEVLAATGEPLSATGTTMPQLMPSRLVSYTQSATFAEVRVDEELGVARVTRVVAAVAAGRILNPKTARSQILGGVVMGIGRALHEEGLFDHRFGRVMNASLADYHVPTNADVYDIDVIFVKEDDPRASPLGVKGVGEIGIVGVAPAIANAIWHATGRRVRSLPITPDKLMG